MRLQLHVFFSLFAPFALTAKPSIDPALSIDLSRLEYAQVTADRQGNIVIAGYAGECTLPVVKPLSRCGAIWIAKLDPAGRNILFATYIGSPRAVDDSVVAIGGAGTDRDGNIAVAGSVSKSGLPTMNAIQPSVNGAWDLYLLKLAADGSRLIYATYLGGSGFDNLQWFQVDDAGSAYVMAYTNSPDFPTTPQSLKASAGSSLAVIAKLSPAGQLVYGASLPYSPAFSYRPFQVDAQGRVLFTSGTEFVRLAPDGSNAQRTPLPTWS